MGIVLLDRGKRAPCFSVNFWNWRPIVEIIRKLDVLPNDVVDGLHESWCGTGLTKEQARRVADAIERDFLPTLRAGERVLLDCTTTTEPDDGVFHKEDHFRNYSTSKEVVEHFVECCRSCSGFDVN